MLAVLFPVFIVLVWQFAMNTGAFDETIMPSPVSIFRSLLTMIENGTFFNYVLTSCWRVGIGFLIGGSLGILLGIPLGLNEKARSITRALVTWMTERW